MLIQRDRTRRLRVRLTAPKSAYTESLEVVRKIAVGDEQLSKGGSGYRGKLLKQFVADRQSREPLRSSSNSVASKNRCRRQATRR